MNINIDTYEKVEEAITKLGQIKVRKLQKEAKLTEKVNNLKDASKSELKDDLEEAKVLEKAIKSFCDSRKQDFATNRTKTFSTGKIGYRVVKSVAIPNAKDKIEKLIGTLNALNLHACVSIEETINKDEIRELDDTQLAKLGLVKKIKDSFRIEPNIEKIGN